MNSLSPQEDPWGLLKRAVNYGRRTDMAAWAAVGLPGIELLLDVATNATEHDFESPSPREALLENLPRAFGAIAGAHPDAFLGVFSDTGLDDNLLVVAGLGKIDSDVATDRLIAAAKSTNRYVRASVAHGLARRDSPKAIQALADLRGDEDYHVRYNVILAIALAQVPADERPQGLALIRLLEQSHSKRGPSGCANANHGSASEANPRFRQSQPARSAEPAPDALTFTRIVSA